MMRRYRAIFLACTMLLVTSACSQHYADDSLVASVQRLDPSIVLLTMHVPPEKKSDGYDEAYATGTVVASGAWGSDILTVQHAVVGAWDMHVTILNRKRVPARVVAENGTLDIALVRTREPHLRVVKLGYSRHLASQVGREIALVGYPIPDAFRDDGLGMATSLDVGRLSSVRKHALEVTLQIVPGESGAPVFLTDTSQIVGMAESRFETEPSIGFALPIDDAKRFLHAHDASHGL